MFRFIIEYSILMDFGLCNNNRSIFVWGFLKDDILACVCNWNLRLVVELWWYQEGFWVSFGGFFFEDCVFCMVKYLNFYTHFYTNCHTTSFDGWCIMQTGEAALIATMKNKLKSIWLSMMDYGKSIWKMCCSSCSEESPKNSNSLNWLRVHEARED
jgi:hypothetical protein